MIIKFFFAANYCPNFSILRIKLAGSPIAEKINTLLFLRHLFSEFRCFFKGDITLSIFELINILFVLLNFRYKNDFGFFRFVYVTINASALLIFFQGSLNIP